MASHIVHFIRSCFEYHSLVWIVLSDDMLNKCRLSIFVSDLLLLTVYWGIISGGQVLWRKVYYRSIQSSLNTLNDLDKDLLFRKHSKLMNNTKVVTNSHTIENNILRNSVYISNFSDEVLSYVSGGSDTFKYIHAILFLLIRTYRLEYSTVCTFLFLLIFTTAFNKWLILFSLMLRYEYYDKMQSNEYAIFFPVNFFHFIILHTTSYIAFLMQL